VSLQRLKKTILKKLLIFGAFEKKLVFLGRFLLGRLDDWEMLTKEIIQSQSNQK
jgi:hypothetical protein